MMQVFCFSINNKYLILNICELISEQPCGAKIEKRNESRSRVREGVCLLIATIRIAPTAVAAAV